MSHVEQRGDLSSALVKQEERPKRAVLVCGARDWDDPVFVRERLVAACEGTDVFCVIEGGASGADAAAGSWAYSSADHERFPARWSEYGPKAGPIRNSVMLDRLLELAASGYEVSVMAFKENFDGSLRRGGTENMVKQARDAGVTVTIFGQRVDGGRDVLIL